MCFCCRAQGCTSASVFSCISLKAHFSGCRNQECPGRMGRRPERISSDPSGSCCYTILPEWRVLGTGIPKISPSSSWIQSTVASCMTSDQWSSSPHYSGKNIRCHFRCCLLLPESVAHNGLLEYFQLGHPIFLLWNWLWILICLQSMMRLEIDTNWTPCGIRLPTLYLSNLWQNIEIVIDILKL